MATRTTFRRSLLLASTLPAGILALLAAGCGGYQIGGGGVSDGTHTFPSTSENPQTITLVDWRDGSVIWSYEVPVGRKLVAKFYDDRFETSPNRPDLMRWEEMPLSQNYGSLNNEMAVPRTRKFILDQRTPGEAAPGAKTKTANGQPAAKQAPSALPD